MLPCSTPLLVWRLKESSRCAVTKVSDNGVKMLADSLMKEWRLLESQ